MEEILLSAAFDPLNSALSEFRVSLEPSLYCALWYRGKNAEEMSG